MSRQSADEFLTVEVGNAVGGETAYRGGVIPARDERLVRGPQDGIAPNQLFRWRKLTSEGGKVVVQADDQVVSASENRALKKRVRELERLLGKKTMEVEILKEAIEIAREKKLISRTPLPFEEDSL